MAHSYSYLYGIPTTGLRFFTVYGPWGRPDMAPFVFAKAIIEGKPIFLYNHGNMIRDFTYVDDIIDAISKLIKKPPIENNIIKSNKEASLNKLVPNKVFNIGKGDPISIHYFVELLENKLNKKAIIKMEQHQLGDVKKTEANTSSLENWIKFRPNISIERGVEKFIDWFIAYHRNS
jgi:UDP-glucuronate 4-epimerase